MAKSNKLVLHCGASQVTRAEVELVPTPPATHYWTPVPHKMVIEQVEDTLKTNRLRVVTQAHALTRDGLRYFGLMQIANGQNAADYAWVLGIRNSHDKSYPAGLVAGAGVFVCDNLSFSGEVRYARKHTPKILVDLPKLTQRAIGGLMDRWHHQDERIEAYKDRALDELHAHDLLVRALDVNACTTTQIIKVLREWRHPQHPEFQDRTVWSLFNCFTEVAKGTSLNELPGRTSRLHGLLDNYVGLPAFKEKTDLNMNL